MAVNICAYFSPHHSSLYSAGILIPLALEPVPHLLCSSLPISLVTH